MRKIKAVFLDKDGTLIPDVPYNVNPDRITLEKGVAEGLQALQMKGFALFVISNQAGIAKGFFEIDALAGVWNKLNTLLAADNIVITDYFYCPHHPDGKVTTYTIQCTCRKPAPGMILKAAAQYNIDVSESWMIGDILHDVEAGNRAGCKTVLINNGNETEWVKGQYRIPTYTATDLLQAAQYICNDNGTTANAHD